MVKENRLDKQMFPFDVKAEGGDRGEHLSNGSSGELHHHDVLQVLIAAQEGEQPVLYYDYCEGKQRIRSGKIVCP